VVPTELGSCLTCQIWGSKAISCQTYCRGDGGQCRYSADGCDEGEEGELHVGWMTWVVA
jgi:hypothetical protein